MRWSVSITKYALRDAHCILSSLPPGQADQVATSIEAAFRAAGDDPRKKGEIMLGDRFRRVLDVDNVRLILDVNYRDVRDPEADLMCWVLGVMMLD